MITNKCVLLFKSILDSNLPSDTSIKMMKLASEMIDSSIFENDCLSFFAGILHEFYSISKFEVRSCILSICMILEAKSTEYITERCFFDLLIVSSLNRFSADEIDKIGIEKNTSFAYISLILDTWESLPDSILRSIVSLYQSNKQKYREVIVAILSKCIVLDDERVFFPEVYSIIFEFLVETNRLAISSLVVYSIENGNYLTNNKSNFYTLLSPFLQAKTIDPSSTINGAISFILRSWPGFIYVGIESGLLSALVYIMPHQPDMVVGIFKDIIRIDCDPQSIIVPFVLYAFDSIQKLGIFDHLKVLATQKASISNFLSMLIPLSQDPVYLFQPKMFSQIPNSSYDFLVQQYQQNIASTNPITSINDVNLQSDASIWDWPSIHLLLSIVLPHSESEAQSSGAKIIYNRLFEFYSGPFLGLGNGKFGQMQGPIIALINLLRSRPWGISIIESNSLLKSAFVQVLQLICGSQLIESESPVWVLFRGLVILMVHLDGIALLSRWGLFSIISSLGDRCTNAENSKQILQLLDIGPDPELSVSVFASFLSSNDNHIHLIALSELKRKRILMPNFQMNGFRAILIPHIKTAYSKSLTVRLSHSLVLFHEIINSDNMCLEFAFGDSVLHEIINQCSHGIYSLFLRIKESAFFDRTIQEIRWWMERGNIQYLEIYDSAMSMSFDNPMSIPPNKYPEIISGKNAAKIPPHLFRELSFHENGAKLLIQHIPVLIDSSKNGSISQKRASILALAHFASHPETQQIVKEYMIIESIVDQISINNSYVLFGTAIQALSMCSRTAEFIDLINRSGLKLFKCGDFSAIIPSAQMSINVPNKSNIKDDFLELEPSKIHSLLVQLSNPLHTKEMKSQLSELLKFQESLFSDPDTALIVYEVLSNYSYSSENRQYLLSLVEDTPLVQSWSYSVDEESYAIEGSKLDWIYSNGVECDFCSLQLPTLPFDELMSKLKLQKSPEVFLSDREFFNVFQMDKKEFYSLTREKIEFLRMERIYSKYQN